MATPIMDILATVDVTNSLKVFNEQFSLARTATQNVGLLGGWFAELRRRRANKVRFRALLKLMAQLAPGRLPSYVIEVDGFSDNELMELFRIDSALYYKAVAASVLEKPEIQVALPKLTASAWTAMLNASEFDERLPPDFAGISVVAAFSGDEERYRNLIENAQTSSQSVVANVSRSVEVKFLSGVMDELGRCDVRTAVLKDEDEGSLLVLKHNEWFVVNLESFESVWDAGIRIMDLKLADEHYLSALLAAYTKMPLSESRIERVDRIKFCLQIIATVRSKAMELKDLELVQEKIFKPSKKDLKDVRMLPTDMTEKVRERIRRTFTVVQQAVKAATTDEYMEEDTASAKDLDFLWKRDSLEPVNILIDRYVTQKDEEVITDSAADGEAGIFATYVYATHGDHRVAEKYDKVFSAYKVCHRYGKSGHLLAVPGGELVMMSAAKMAGVNVEYCNNQIFVESATTRILFLPAMLAALGVATNETLANVLVMEFERNPLVVTDPFTNSVCSTVRALLENKILDIGKIQHQIIERLGEMAGAEVVREIVALLARLGAKADMKHGRSCFFDVTCKVKGYKPGPIFLKFTGGVTLHNLKAAWFPQEEKVLFGTYRGLVVTAKATKDQVIRTRGDSRGTLSGIFHLEVTEGTAPRSRKVMVNFTNAYAQGV